ncbi:MAG: hypothetical protein KDB14_05850 [Planctomycetales bacterium]|nr:hypothetical protein [Planctomycetales bacterium]
MLGQHIATKKVNGISDADNQKFIDDVCHDHLEDLLHIRISDPKLLALIRRFLKAGVMIEGQRFDTEDGVQLLGARCVNGARPDLRGGDLNCHRSNIETPPQETVGQQGTQTVSCLNRKLALLTRSGRRREF